MLGQTFYRTLRVHMFIAKNNQPTYDPEGVEQNDDGNGYKHIFPSGY